ncbi:hypothetical protein A1O3_04899 [Capronia epimyces CBS 606.96]|uniref:Uncharacterized protein n=1 Tax=Capronia epimyces CBS 606.96 TaxID=1182542 RepID=W9XUI1_9EURO|nr:uncharacterized protein A1O3_04899 [Capronia epimyces CBS 606.96]EXJ84232.1 hypothetical protein A1O3_04899 [Capronia epimyces CBS 606.96]
MATSQTWGHALEVPYNPAATASVSSYFARPLKVVKSNSRNGSPRDLGRRKTTTAATISSRARSVVDHLRSNVHSQQWQCSESSRSRPLSWHPTSIEEHDMVFDPSVSDQGFSGWNFSTAQVNGLFTPISYPAINEPQMEELYTPLEELPGPDVVPAYEARHFGEQAWLGQDPPKVQPYSFGMFPQSSSPQPPWQFSQGAMLGEVPTAPSSPDFFPVPNMDLGTLSLDNTGDNEDAEELVGMGLYDSPAEVQSSSFLCAGLSSGRRALKLEESFEPMEQDDGEEGEEGDDDDDEAAQGQETFEQDAVLEHAPDSSGEANYNSQSIASHLTFGTQSEVNPIAFKYLATLSQLNSAYYPAASHGYGWI